MADIQVPLITMIDIRCHIGGCSCDTIVPGNILKSGGYCVAEEAGTICEFCNHAFADHRVLGEAKSGTEHHHK